MPIKKVYICGAINGAPPALLKLYEDLGDFLRKQLRFQVYVPHIETKKALNYENPEVASAIFTLDMKGFNDADLVIAYLGEPSLGAGAELALAWSAKKQIIAFHEEGKTVSKFIQGMLKEANATVFVVPSVPEYDSEPVQSHIGFILGAPGRLSPFFFEKD